MTSLWGIGERHSDQVDAYEKASWAGFSRPFGILLQLRQRLHHDAGFHDPGDVLHDRGAVQGAAGGGAQISVLAGLDGAQVLGEREKLCPVNGRSLQRFEWSHAAADECSKFL